MLTVGFFALKPNGTQIENGSAEYEYDYEASSKVIEDLEDIDVESKYNLTNLYPMINENQTNSNFCWIYASLKSLESSFMVQKNEYYNFSEVGQAYLYYLYDIGKYGLSASTYNSDGNFQLFVAAYQDYGLILESDYSNSNYADIDTNVNRYTYYNEIKELATKELNSYFKPYELFNCTRESNKSLKQEEKIELVKKYIKTYGALYAGIEGSGYYGCFYTEANETTSSEGIINFYDYDRSRHQNYTKLQSNHAITIVGWNDDVIFGADKGAYIAMNSWGFEENSIELFYIPYSYDKILETFCGFICNDEEMVIALEESNNANFNSIILNSDKQLYNYFCYTDEIFVKYNLKLDTLQDVSVELSQGNDVKNNYTITRDEKMKTIAISLKKNDEFYGGYYTISFYNSGGLIGKRTFYVYSGTEIGDFKIKSYDGVSYVEAEYIFNNAFLSTERTSTVSVNNGLRYYFYFNFANNTKFSKVNENQGLWKGVNISITDVSIINSNDNSIETKYSQIELISNSGLFSTFSINETKNLFSFEIGRGIKLSEFTNSLIKFKITIKSVIYDNCAKDFYVNLLVSEIDYEDSQSLNTIVYDLGGGENNAQNITKFPNYIKDTAMTEITLYNPIKNGASFDGWYLTPDFSGEVLTKISNANIGNIKLYAKWVTQDIEYFNIALSLSKITTYEKTEKDLNDAIIYGDSICVDFKFKNLEIGGNSFKVYYYFYGVQTESGYLELSNGSDGVYTKRFSVGFPNLSSGNHIFRIKVIVNINDYVGVIIRETAISVYVQKKLVEFEFSNLEKPYNGEIQKPTVIKKGFYEEDILDDDKMLRLVCEGESRNAREYHYSIEGLLNDNYYFEGEYSCNFKIEKLGIILKWQDNYYQVYDGKNHPPKYEILNKIPGDKVSFSLTTTQCINAGKYKVNIDPYSITNSNYKAGDNEDFEFEILKAKVKIKLYNVTERVQTKSHKRAIPEYTVTGNYYTIDDMQISVVSEGFVATKSGNYVISCSLGSPNYECEVEKATYILTGFYYVYYQLENGKAYAEKVEEGETPKGVTKKQLDVPLFSKINYSDDYVVTGNDIYVAVSVDDYSGTVYMAVFVGVFVVVCLIYYFKKRESKVR